MRVAFAHHLALEYSGGGERWIAEVSRELVHRGHEVEIFCLPIIMKGSFNSLPDIGDTPYHVGYFHHITGFDVAYVTYHPLSWLSFRITSPKIAGIHSHCYWQPINRKYGLLPNLANFVHSLVGESELKRFDSIHTITNLYPMKSFFTHYIPNFVDSSIFYPRNNREHEFTVGFASRQVWQKGYDVWEQIKAALPDVNFIETGNLCAEEVPVFLSRCHVVVVPTRVDTFGLTIVESAMCGALVISSGLPTHECLGLPLMYARKFSDYIHWITKLKQIHEVGWPDTSYMRKQALEYDKQAIIDRIEEMLVEVATR